MEGDAKFPRGFALRGETALERAEVNPEAERGPQGVFILVGISFGTGKNGGE